MLNGLDDPIGGEGSGFQPRTKVFYRLGSKIEHNRKKYGTLVPKDPHKWAVICEHIIRHYNEGWADGFHLNMQYWEIMIIMKWKK